MKKTMSTMLFVNLPVKNLNRTIKFFAKLGFKFDKRFTDENATCMIIGEGQYVMLLVDKFFIRFTKGKKILNAKKNTESMTAIYLDSRKKVDKMVDTALKAGAKQLQSYEHGEWMYGRDFEDLDGHIWEIFYMDESKFPKKKKRNSRNT
jgi:uncharacterized protein